MCYDIGNMVIDLLAYIDDLILFGNNLEAVQQHLQKINECSRQGWSEKSTTKTKYVIIERTNKQKNYICIYIYIYSTIYDTETISSLFRTETRTPIKF